MSKTYCELYYHATWGTYEREPVITEEMERALYPFLEIKAKRFGGFLHAVGGVEDHIHVVVRIPASTSVGDFLGKSELVFPQSRPPDNERFQLANGIRGDDRLV